jgi:Ca2+-binding EF-hand superfamily protein
MTDRGYLTLRHLIAKKKGTKASKFCKAFVHDIFDKFDDDKNNHLDRKELTNIFGAHYKET